MSIVAYFLLVTRPMALAALAISMVLFVMIVVVRDLITEKILE
ncbi:hypothetical protein BH10CYA1_BH10CYA1_48230 [soil metagenome]